MDTLKKQFAIEMIYDTWIGCDSSEIVSDGLVTLIAQCQDLADSEPEFEYEINDFGCVTHLALHIYNRALIETYIID